SVELDLRPSAVPASLTHRIEYAVGDEAFVVAGAPVAVGAAAIVLGPPLRDGPWIAVHHPGWARGHRRVIYALDGAARIPGRYAIDFVKVDARGALGRGDTERASNHFGYASDVIAAADARGAATRDGVAESATLAGNAAHSLAEASGNFVVLEVAPRRFAF